MAAAAAVLIALAVAGPSLGCHEDTELPADSSSDSDSDSDSDGPASDEPMPALGERPMEPGCQLPGTAASALPRLAAQPAIEGLSFPDAVQLLPAPAELGDLLVVVASGQIWRVWFDPDDATGHTELLVDLGDRVDTGQTRGLLAAALGPDPDPSELFVHYHRAAFPERTRVARLALDLGAKIVDPDSETVVLEVLHTGTAASGGGLSFDDDGLLLVGVGDDSPAPPASPASSPARDRLDLRGAILRLDVSAPGPGYAIPAQNPFVADPSGADELLASGFHDPRHCLVDPGARAWCVDLGTGLRDELDALVPGADYGWPIVEGLHCTSAVGDCDASLYSDPHADYGPDDPDPAIHHCELRGGLVYRGEAGADLVELGLGGTYLFGDRCSGRVWGLRTEVGAGAFEVLASVPAGVACLGADRHGEPWLIDSDGQLAALAVAPGGVPGSLPSTLASSGCVPEGPATAGGAELVPFQVASALWSDGLFKRRFMVIPPGERVLVGLDGRWTFPEGSLLIKTFGLDPERPVETRFMVRRNGVWEFHSYRWREDLSDADLLAGSDERTLELDGPEGPQSFMWSFPDETGCRACHGFAASSALGPVTAQLNRQVRYDDGASIEETNQIAALAAAELLDFEAGPTPDPDLLPALPDPRDPNLSLDARARSYLDSNCAPCHEPSWMRPDLRYTTALVDSGMCLATEFPSPWVGGSQRVAPGQPEDSNLWLRMDTRGMGQMPPLGTAVVDPLGTALVGDWIRGLESCP